MSSQRRIASSRANGAKSRGPATPQGKRASSANNLRHGFLSTMVVLEDEDEDTFHEMYDGFLIEYNPQTETERALVETMAAARWRLHRIWTIERAAFQTEIDMRDGEIHPPAVRAAMAFRALADNSPTLQLLARYESRFDRQFNRALNQLMRLANPENPLTKFRHSNPIPQPDTGSSGPDLSPDAAETENLAPAASSPPDSVIHADSGGQNRSTPAATPQFRPAAPPNQSIIVTPTTSHRELQGPNALSSIDQAGNIPRAEE